MLKLILGRAKSGKTAAMMDAVCSRVEQGFGNTVLLIPEQYSHEAEMELLRVCGDRLCLYAEVLSFTRLALRVEAELGMGGQTPLDRGGRALCLARAVDAVGSRLRVCGSARRQPELQQRLLQAIDECKTACISPDALADCADGRKGMLPPERSGLLRDKLSDLALVYGAYEAIAAQSGLDPMDRLTRLAERLPDSRYGKSCFYIDGFTDFTAQESRVIETLLRTGADVTVCLTAEGMAESHAIFEPSRKAALRLQRLAESLHCPFSTETLTASEDGHPMNIVERELFSFGSARFDAGDKISLSCAPDITGECEAAAASCLALVRKTGCRWRDVAVCARNYDTYRAALESIFPHYGIPLFSARKSDLTEKPPVALLLSAYAVVTGGWELDDMLTYLKTGLAGLDRGECDTLENYAFLWTIHGSTWTRPEDWTMHPAGFSGEYTDEVRAALSHINALRRRATAPLQVLAQAGAAAYTAEGQARALADFFRALQLPARLDARAKALKARGMVQAAAEYAQIWELIAGALEQSAAILGDAEMDMETFGKLFCHMLTAYEIGSIPLSLDRVYAGDMERMRRRHIRHLIVLGCDSTSLPQPVEEQGIFSDEDRVALQAAGLELGSTADSRLDREFALIYNCLTLPEDTLSLSWCAGGGEGGRAQPAFVVKRLETVFGLKPSLPLSLEYRSSAPGPAFSLAAAAAAGGTAPMEAAALAYFRQQGRAEELQRLNAAAHQDRGRLSRSAVRSLYGDTLRLSASRVDKLASCQFSYFMQYGLKAKPRQPAEFSPPEFGAFLHFVLEGVAREITESGGFAVAAPKTVAALCDKYVARYVHEKLNDLQEKTPRFVYLFRRLTRDVRSIVGDMVAELAEGEFVPRDFELNFGDPAAFPPLRLGQGEDRLVLTGIADRVDGYVHDGKLYVRVVDYKTGKKSFSLSDVWYGMGLQMLLYLFALQRSGPARYGQDIVPAGVLYVPARDVLVSARTDMTAEQILAEKAKNRRRSGLLLNDSQILAAMERGETPKYIPVSFKNGAYEGDALASAEQLGALSRHIDKTLQALAAELRSGSVAADPWFRSQSDSACSNCEFAAACHFNAQDDHFRYLSRMQSGEVWSKLLPGEEAQT